MREIVYLCGVTYVQQLRTENDKSNDEVWYEIIKIWFEVQLSKTGKN